MMGLDSSVAFMVLGVVVLLVVLLARQCSAQRRELIRAARLNSFLRTLSHADRMILRVQSDAELWREACDICVDTGKSVLASVYVLDGMLVHRVASAGPAVKLLENVPQTLDMNTPELRGTYTAQVLFDGVRLVSNDYVLDPRAGRWREEAVAQGVRAIAWIPLRRAGSVVAALMLCADQRDYFDAELLRSLDELGEDLSLALDGIERNRERLAAQLQVEAGLDRFRALFNCAPVPMAILSIAERRILEVNDALCSWYGMDRADIIGSVSSAHAYGLVPEDREQFYRTLNADGKVRNLVLRVRDAQGTEHQEVFNAKPIEYLGQACCLVTSVNLQWIYGRGGEGARSNAPNFPG
ncbi:GAF domain-containing protein [Roseateles toxinivorans]|uniref:PAS domain S-box-containing protein n=1 Tax=Roseateles toxinivorans TaxID=270368 RepID=A0A4R6QRZ5_9BURK|nr:GAF domain-containing protein [Roseateles toxinivorans]TDP74390.1 PAS domain S-box-containing protein [Roseateles toxinivorans]